MCRKPAVPLSGVPGRRGSGGNGSDGRLSSAGLYASSAFRPSLGPCSAGQARKLPLWLHSARTKAQCGAAERIDRQTLLSLSSRPKSSLSSRRARADAWTLAPSTSQASSIAPFIRHADQNACRYAHCASNAWSAIRPKNTSSEARASHRLISAASLSAPAQRPATELRVANMRDQEVFDLSLQFSVG